MASARKHHYVSQFYLEGFCDTQAPSRGTHVLDVNTGKWFHTSTSNIGAERDFNRINVDGREIDALETELSQFEGEAAAALRRVIDSKKLPDDEDLNWILNLICLYVCRNPRMRAGFNRAREQTVRILGEILVSNEQIYNSHIAKAKEAGYVKPNSVSFDEIRRFVHSGEYEIEIPTDENHRVEFHAFDTVLPLLGERYWTLLITEAGAPGFICCDHPVTITYKERGRRMSVGVGTKNTELVFPLNPNLALYGVYETPLKSEVKIGADRLATFNSRIAFNAKRHIYSCKPYFVMRKDGQLITCTKGGLTPQ